MDKHLIVSLPVDFVAYVLCVVNVEEANKRKTDELLMNLCIEKGKELAKTLYEVLLDERKKSQSSKT